MYVFAIRGGGAERALERLLPALDGRVAAVRTGGATTGGAVGTTDGGVATARTATEYVLEGDGWRASGDGDSGGEGKGASGVLTVGGVLDRLAPDHDYAAIIGAIGDEQALDLPTIAVGVDDPGEADFAVYDATDLPVEEAVAAIEAAEPYETLESLVAAVKQSPDADYAGAISTFTGRVRAKEDSTDDLTRYLEFEKYEGVAERRMRRIERELEDREGVLEVRLHHRTGRITDGEDIVFVVVLAGHRGEAFRTVEDGIDRLKDEVPLFKKEVTESDTFWVHEQET